MGSRKVNTWVMIALILGSGLAADQLLFEGAGLNAIMGLFDGGLGGNVYSGQSAAMKFTPYKKGTNTAIVSVEAYAWFDWDLDGAVDLGEYPEGEIESLTGDGTSGEIATQMMYPIGSEVYFQLHSSTYEVLQIVRQINSVPAGYDGSALGVPHAFLILTDTGASRLSVDGTLLVTDTGDYGYTSGTTEPVCTFRHTATSADAGVSSPQYTHWSTGKTYSGSVVIATFTNQDFIDLHPDGYDGVHVGGAITTIWWFTNGYFNDAAQTGDDVFTLSFVMDITAAGDIATIGMYSDVELKNLEIGVLNTAIGTEETNLDFTAT